MKAPWPWESPVSRKSNSRSVSSRYFPCLEEPATLDGGTLSVWVSCHQPRAVLRDSRKPGCLSKLLHGTCGWDWEYLWWEHHFSLDVQLETQRLKWKPQLPARHNPSPKVQGCREVRYSDSDRRKYAEKLGEKKCWGLQGAYTCQCADTKHTSVNLSHLHPPVGSHFPKQHFTGHRHG